jgi:acetyl esterase/lipase
VAILAIAALASAGERRDVLCSSRRLFDQRHPLLGLNPTDELKHHLSVDEQVTRDTPPTFLVHSAEDRELVEGSVLFSTAMRRAGAPVELHIYAKGPHGDGMSPALGPISEWPRRCEL